tara:strand:- start:2083 stop:2253 length:171 start_codon:yes stop_codon:yes gene_type:complete
MNKTPGLTISRETIKAMILDADSSYKEAFKKGDRDLQMWFDGYVRALYRILDYESL